MALSDFKLTCKGRKVWDTENKALGFSRRYIDYTKDEVIADLRKEFNL